MNKSVQVVMTVLLVGMLLGSVWAQDDVCGVFVKTNGSSSQSEVINAMTRTADGGFAVTGYSVSTASKSVFVAKFDRAGVRKWWNSFGGSEDEEGRGIVETQDGSLIIVGYTRSFGDGADFFLAKRPSDDSPSSPWDWTRRWGGGEGQDEELNGVIEATDGSIWVTGYTRSYSSSPYRAQVVLASLSAGETRLLGRYAGNPGLDRDYRGYALAEVFGAYPGFCVTGTFEQLSDQDVLLAKFSSTADFWWADRIGAGVDYDETGTSIIRTSDACLAIAGWVNFYDGIYPNQKAGFVIKTDSDAQVDWGRRAFGTPPFVSRYCMSVAETFDGGLVVTGKAGPYLQEDRLILSKWDCGGVAIWNRGFELGDLCIGNTVVEDADNSLLVAGSTYTEGSDWTDALVGRWCSTGITCLPDADGPSYSSWDDAPQQRIRLPDPDSGELDVVLTTWNHAIANPYIPTSTLCEATVHTVCPDGSGDYMAIQPAIDAASNGDVVALCDATFVGPLNRDLDFQGKCLTLRSQSGHPDDCVIDCQNAGRGFYFHSGEGPNSIVQDIKIIHGSSADGGAGIHCDDAHPTLHGCIIADCDGSGIYCIDASPTIMLCQILGCYALGGGGILAFDGSPIISDCRIAGCASSGGAIGIVGGSATITGCQVTGNDGGGIEFDLADGGTIRNCTVSGNGAGTFAGGLSFFECFENTEVTNTIVWGNCEPQIRCAGPVERWGCADLSCCDVQGGWPGVNNLDADPLFCASVPYQEAPTEEGNYGLRPGSVCLAENQPVCGLIGALAVGCEYTFLVCPDGSCDYPTIQAAIDAAGNGAIIELTDGDFTGGGNYGISFGGKTLTVRSQNGPENCTIDVFPAGTKGPWISPRRGFTFINGEGSSAVLEGVSIIHGNMFGPGNRGGAIFCDGSSPTIRNCWIKGNSAAGDGGGVLCTNSAGPLLDSCVITGNRAGDDGGGVYVDASCPIDIDQCTISGNRAVQLGGGIYGVCVPTRSIIWGNCAETGMGDEWYGDGACEIAGFCDDIRLDGLDGFDSCMVVGTLGLNIDEDPLFCDPEDCLQAPTTNGDYHLDVCSPCTPPCHPDSGCSRIGSLDTGCSFIGDLNLDRKVNSLDIQPFVWTILDADPPCTLICRGDVNQDGALDCADIPPFVQLLLLDP